MRKSILLMLSSVLTYSSFAQEATEPKATFAFSGYLDSYYFANLNKPASRTNLGAGIARAFDINAGTFALGLVQTKLAYTSASGKTDAVVDLTFGPNADLGQYGNVAGPLGGPGSSLAIKQAYFNWKPTSKLTLTAGQFGTHIGYEVIDAPVNVNYSLSNLFNNGPFYHIGVKANLAITDKFAIMAGLVNNVDGLYDNNRAKGLIGQVFLSPVSGWNVYLNGITSNENTADDLGNTPDGSYSVIDLTTSYQITPKFLVGFNGAIGEQNDLGWSGFALYSNVSVTDKFNIGGRFESFNNTDGARASLLTESGAGVTMNALTLTGTFTCGGGNLLLKPEFRIDTADKDFFEDDKGAFNQKSQSTIGMAMIYKF